jgi:hypothetical protein
MRGRVPGFAGADARRRDAGNVGAHCRGAPTPQMPPQSRNPKGSGSAQRPSRMGIARRSLRCSSSTMGTGIASSSRLALAAQAPCARPLLILGQAPSVIASQIAVWPTDNFAGTRDHRKCCRFSYSCEGTGRLSKPFCDCPQRTELSGLVKSWDGFAVVIQHPLLDGSPESSRSVPFLTSPLPHGSVLALLYWDLDNSLQLTSLTRWWYQNIPHERQRGAGFGRRGNLEPRRPS